MTLALRIRGETMTVQQALDECLEDIRSGGATVEECLRRYPEFADELRPMLRMARRLESANEVRPTRAFKTRLRKDLIGEDKSSRTRALSWRLALIWIVLSALLLGALVWLGIAFQTAGRLSTPFPPISYAAPSSFVQMLSSASPLFVVTPPGTRWPG